MTGSGRGCENAPRLLMSFSVCRPGNNHDVGTCSEVLEEPTAVVMFLLLTCWLSWFTTPNMQVSWFLSTLTVPVDGLSTNAQSPNIPNSKAPDQQATRSTRLGTDSGLVRKFIDVVVAVTAKSFPGFGRSLKSKGRLTGRKAHGLSRREQFSHRCRGSPSPGKQRILRLRQWPRSRSVARSQICYCSKGQMQLQRRIHLPHAIEDLIYPSFLRPLFCDCDVLDLGRARSLPRPALDVRESWDEGVIPLMASSLGGAMVTSFTGGCGFAAGYTSSLGIDAFGAPTAPKSL